MKIERRKIWWLSDPKRRRAGPSGLKTSTTSPLCPTLRIRSLSSTVVEFGRSSSRAPIFSPPLGFTCAYLLFGVITRVRASF